VIGALTVCRFGVGGLVVCFAQYESVETSFR